MDDIDDVNDDIFNFAFNSHRLTRDDSVSSSCLRKAGEKSISAVPRCPGKNQRLADQVQRRYRAGFGRRSYCEISGLFNATFSLKHIPLFRLP